MPKEISEFEIGGDIGEIILALFKLIARLDDVTVQEALDEWVAAYFAARVAEGQ